MLEKFIDNDVMGFERVLRDIEKILLLNVIYNFFTKYLAWKVSMKKSSYFWVAKTYWFSRT